MLELLPNHQEIKSESTNLNCSMGYEIISNYMAENFYYHFEFILKLYSERLM